MPSSAMTPYHHRLHYRWSQLEADRGGQNVGSPLRPLPKPARSVRLRLQGPGEWPFATSLPAREARERQRFAACADVYQSIDYHTFSKNGGLKLTEVELAFLSAKMTRSSSCLWAVVYLGIGPGDRFRYLRDQFFPDLTVIAFDPIDDNYAHLRDYARENAKYWSEEGKNFSFHVRCFDLERDGELVREQARGKKLLFISDIRGCSFKENGAFDKGRDQDIQWQAIKLLRPEASMVKFDIPNPQKELYEYAPGIIWKQVYCNYGTRETRLLIDGVPEHTQIYNAWELQDHMALHHEHLRGLVYETTRRFEGTACLDCSFDCSVLWDTLETYGRQNSVDPYQILRNLFRHHVFGPSSQAWGRNYSEYIWTPTTAKQRWWDAAWTLNRGRLTEALAILEAEGDEDSEGTDWVSIADFLDEQPGLAWRIRWSLRRPARRTELVQLLGQLSAGGPAKAQAENCGPFTLLRTEMNGLFLKDEEKQETEEDEEKKKKEEK
eukprot:TRINITY_DN22330_c0_g1_i1.p1 TRINITY_DN22330_c0_g1~~TRINITY_DN22330_c0_g1_i1.p1  ORF type:complete len:494 (+),score=121.25 TRINITY_DN22330_c0_g1_i1:85-1566(+)